MFMTMVFCVIALLAGAVVGWMAASAGKQRAVAERDLAVAERQRADAAVADVRRRLEAATQARVAAETKLAAVDEDKFVALASREIAPWLPTLVLWWAKPWLDRTILFVLSRAAFGRTTTAADVWKAQRQVWWNQLLFTWTVRRLSPWRSLTEPVYQLEGLSMWRAGARVRQIRQRGMGSALMMTQAFSLSELALTLALVSLVFWLSPAGQGPDIASVLSGELPIVFAVGVPVSYAIAVMFLEPFYVAAGFTMYLNRRAELEAWDIEQEFRRAFAQ